MDKVGRSMEQIAEKLEVGAKIAQIALKCPSCKTEVKELLSSRQEFRGGSN